MISENLLQNQQYTTRHETRCNTAHATKAACVCFSVCVCVSVGFVAWCGAIDDGNPWQQPLGCRAWSGRFDSIPSAVPSACVVFSHSLTGTVRYHRLSTHHTTWQQHHIPRRSRKTNQNSSTNHQGPRAIAVIPRADTPKRVPAKGVCLSVSRNERISLRIRLVGRASFRFLFRNSKPTNKSTTQKTHKPSVLLSSSPPEKEAALSPGFAPAARSLALALQPSPRRCGHQKNLLALPRRLLELQGVAASGRLVVGHDRSRRRLVVQDGVVPAATGPLRLEHVLLEGDLPVPVKGFLGGQHLRPGLVVRVVSVAAATAASHTSQERRRGDSVRDARGERPLGTDRDVVQEVALPLVLGGLRAAVVRKVDLLQVGVLVVVLSRPPASPAGDFLVDVVEGADGGGVVRLGRRRGPEVEGAVSVPGALAALFLAVAAQARKDRHQRDQHARPQGGGEDLSAGRREGTGSRRLEVASLQCVKVDHVDLGAPVEDDAHRGVRRWLLLRGSQLLLLVISPRGRYYQPSSLLALGGGPRDGGPPELRVKGNVVVAVGDVELLRGRAGPQRSDQPVLQEARDPRFQDVLRRRFGGGEAPAVVLEHDERPRVQGAGAGLRRGRRGTARVALDALGELVAEAPAHGVLLSRVPIDRGVRKGKVDKVVAEVLFEFLADQDLEAVPQIELQHLFREIQVGREQTHLEGIEFHLDLVPCPWRGGSVDVVGVVAARRAVGFRPFVFGHPIAGIVVCRDNSRGSSGAQRGQCDAPQEDTIPWHCWGFCGSVRVYVYVYVCVFVSYEAR
mmetsp:Transcript_26584/g.54903  ORF Transcript_26584/g.54903 Transcript_26584/m.54903 type:complete len:792 (+) Transcript_26584:294-2669(+)